MSVCKTKYCDYCHSDVTNSQKMGAPNTFSALAPIARVPPTITTAPNRSPG